MRTLLILGAGQYGTVAKEIAEAMGGYERIEFLDDSSDQAIGGLMDFDKQESDSLFIAIGNSKVRSEYVQRVLSKGYKLVSLVHPLAVVSPSARIGAGSIVEAGACVCSNAVVGHACIVMANAVVGHNAAVGDCCQLKYNCTVAERAFVPDATVVPPNTVWEA